MYGLAGNTVQITTQLPVAFQNSNLTLPRSALSLNSILSIANLDFSEMIPFDCFVSHLPCLLPQPRALS